METRRNTDLRRNNALAVLDNLRDGGRMSRADLAERTTLSSQALATILNGLVKSRYVVEVEVRGGRRGRGRPALLYEYNARQATVVSVYVGLRYSELQVCDAAGTPLLPNEEFSPGWDPATVADEAAQRITAALAALGTPPADCLVAVVIHGTVDSASGIADSPQMGWAEVPIAALLAERTGLDVTVHDASRVAAIAEHREGAGVGARRSVVFNPGPEIGVTIVHDGQVEAGSFGLAGQLGGTLVPVDGEIGTLQELIGSVAIKERYSRISGHHVDWVTDVYRLAHEGDSIAQSMIERIFDGVSFAAAWLIAVQDPERFIVTGALAEVGQRLQLRLRELIVDRCDPMFLERTRIELSPLGRQAWTRGGVHAAIDRHRQREAARL